MSGGLTIHAVLRPRDNQGAGAIRVWVGLFGEAEDFTLDEARAICVRGDLALLESTGADGRFATIDLDDGPLDGPAMPHGPIAAARG